MYKVLIVDDEVLVRVGLKTTIDWEANGFSVVAEAPNGEQGFEQYRKHMPDVIITDIRMPKKDGLWLVEEVRKENRNVKILVLTCYDEFSYARKALKLGADDYILKSEVEDEELISVIQALKKKIDDYNRVKHIEVQDLMNINYVKRSIFADMIKAGFNIDPDMAERCAGIEFPLSGTSLAFARISIGNAPDGENRNPEGHVENAVLNTLIDLLSERDIKYIYTNFESGYVFLLASPLLSETELSRFFSTASDSIKRYFDHPLNAVFTGPVSDVKDCGGLYKSFMEKSQILFYKNNANPFISGLNGIHFGEPNVFNLKKRFNREIIEVIGQEDIAAAKELLAETHGYFEGDNVSPSIVRIFYSNLIGDIFSSYGLILENSKTISNQQYYHYQIENSLQLQDMKTLLLDFLTMAIGEIRHMRFNNSRLLINRALNYINSHYEEKISLEDVARELHLSKQYLCNTFKKETGENMSLYINKLRIEKAKKLLLEQDGRIKEIFEDVGYSNQQYFSKVFKRITGMTIMEYKENRHSNKKDFIHVGN